MVIWSYEKKNNSREQMINFPVRDGGDTSKDLDYYYETFGIHTRTFSTLLTIETIIRWSRWDIFLAHVQSGAFKRLLKWNNNKVKEVININFTEGNTLFEDLEVSNDAIQKCLPVIEEFNKQPGLLPIASHYMVPLTSQLNKMGHLFAEDDDRNEVLCIETANSGARFWRRVCWDG